MLADLKTVYDREKWSLLLRGLFSIAIGIFIVVRPLQSVEAFALVIALWALFDGVSAIVHSIDLRRVLPHWGLYLFSGIVAVLFGLVALFDYPALSLQFAVIWTTVWLITVGAIGVYVAFKARSVGLSDWGWSLAMGLVAIAAGVVAILFPWSTILGLVSLVAVFAFVVGILRVVVAAKLHSYERQVGKLPETLSGPPRGEAHP